eukprot:347261-Pelagomonas_calceolata.AAC.1
MFNSSYQTLLVCPKEWVKEVHAWWASTQSRSSTWLKVKSHRDYRKVIATCEGGGACSLQVASSCEQACVKRQIDATPYVSWRHVQAWALTGSECHQRAPRPQCSRLGVQQL